MENKYLKILFVCTGNICRSPMADIILTSQLKEQNVNNVEVSSAGTGSWHTGQAADERTQLVLKEYGYPTRHVARKITHDDKNSTLIIAMDSSHKKDLIRLGFARDKISLMRDFDPQSPENSEVSDPYYGDINDFRRVRSEIEKSMPNLVNWIKNELESENFI